MSTIERVNQIKEYLRLTAHPQISSMLKTPWHSEDMEQMETGIAKKAIEGMKSRRQNPKA